MRNGKNVLALFLLVIGLNLLSTCGTAPTTVVAIPTNSPTPTLTALPTVPAALPSATAGATQTSTPTATPLPPHTATSTPSPSPTLPPSTTATPRPPAATQGATITPTQTVTPTVTPSLTPTPQVSPTPLPTAIGSGDWLNILLIGLDSTTNLKSQNTDVILVVSINRDTKQVSLLSIPRDLWVYIPTHGWSRINTAHRSGFLSEYPGEGPGLLMRTIEMNLGIPIDHWARIDFQGFTRVVDDLGGVDMTVACPVDLQYRPDDTNSGDQVEQILQPGVYHMDGATALRYVRTRRGGSDFDRARRQHQFLKAMWDQRKNLDLARIRSLFSALSKSVKTDLGLGDLPSLASLALNLKPQRIRSRYVGPAQTTDWTNADGWQVLLPRYDRIQEAVAGLYAPPSANEDRAASEAARIQVRNGTSRTELGQIVADQLHWAGLNVVDTGLADNPNYPHTRILVFNDNPAAVSLLREMLQLKPEDIIRQPDPNQPVDIQVILGADYDPCQ